MSEVQWIRVSRSSISRQQSKNCLALLCTALTSPTARISQSFIVEEMPRKISLEIFDHGCPRILASL